MSTGQLDDGFSSYGNEDDDFNEYCEEVSGIKQTEIDLLVPRIVDAQSRCHFLCTEFHETAELIFASDSERYIRAILAKRENIGSASIVEGWSAMNVFRYRRYRENPPDTAELIMRDARWKKVDSLRSFLAYEDDFPGLENGVRDVVLTILQNQNRHQKPSAAFLSFLRDLLVAGEIEGVPEVAANFIDAAKHGLQARKYDEHFDDQTLLRYHASSITRLHQSSFIEVTGVPARQIGSLSQLTDVLCGAGFSYEVDIRLYFLYLDALDDTVPEAAIRSVVMEIEANNPVTSIRKKAWQTLERLGWMKKDHAWIRVAN